MGADRYRRGLYTYWWRATPHPALAVFDAPDAFSACTRRIRSNTPLQALTLLNDEAFIEFARAFAREVALRPDHSDASRMEYAFKRCLTRKPHVEEKERLMALLRGEMQSLSAAATEASALAGALETSSPNVTKLAAWTSVCRVLLNLDETITRE
jgi:hypothetical protein